MVTLRKVIDRRHNADPVQKTTLPFQHLINQEQNDRRQAWLKGFKEAGRIIPPEEYARRDKGESQLELMGHRVAQRLQRLGRPGYHTGEDVYFVGANSQTEKLVPPFWRSNANPYVQRQKRRKIFKTLALYMQDEASKPGVKFRMWVIHDGPRCHAMHLPRRWAAQAAKVTDWNESEFAQRLDVKIVFRSAEAGSPVKKSEEKTYNPKTGRYERIYLLNERGQRIPCRDENNCQTWHPHSHLIVRVGRWLSPEEWSELIDRAQKHFGTKKLDAGPINDPREACKYVLKCDELDDCRDIDFLRFLKWTFKRRLVSFYGEVKDLKRTHERDGMRIVSEWDAKTQTTKYVERKSHHVNVVKKDLPKPWNPPSKFDKTVLVAKLDPLAYFSPIQEPILLVRGVVNWDKLHKRRDVQELLEKTQMHYDAALDAFPLIYGCSMEQFLNGVPAFTQATRKAELGFDYVESRAALLGSAHTPPVISRFKTEPDAPEDKRASLIGCFYPPGDVGAANSPPFDPSEYFGT